MPSIPRRQPSPSPPSISDAQSTDPRALRPDTTKPRKPAPLHVTKTLWPPQQGTIKLTRRYGPSLLCVRYRQDASGLRRYTTVEVVIDEVPVGGRQANNRLYAVRIAYDEHQLRLEVKSHGAQWDADSKRWTMRGWLVKHLKLEDRAQPVRPPRKG